MWDVRSLRSHESKLASRHEDGKNVSSKILQIKTNPDDATGNILKYKASVNWSVMQFRELLFFPLP